MSESTSGPIYESVGFPRVLVSGDPDGVTIHANEDGFRSLARLCETMAARQSADSHIHLTPSMQLDVDSLPLTVTRWFDDGTVST